MKKLPFLIFFIFFTVPLFADHLKGGWIYYEYLGVGSTTNTSKYKITVKQYMRCDASGGQLDADVALGIFDGGTNQLLQTRLITITQTEFENKSNFSCITNAPTICYRVDQYVDIVDLPDNTDGYILSVQRCCRVSGIVNVKNSSTVGITYTNKIPGIINGLSYRHNTSPVFAQKDTVLVCHNTPFTFDFSATDADGDSLSYSFIDGFLGGDQTTAGTRPNPPVIPPPPYIPNAVLPYNAGFSGSSPLGPSVSIDPLNGIISGIAPNTTGTYVVAVVANEYRGGILIGTTRKEIHIDVGSCQFAGAQLNPIPVTCDGFNVTFSNAANSPLDTSYYWSFNDPRAGPDSISTLPNPTHQYTDTGIYKVKLVVNRGSFCSDSTTTLVKVYPGFAPGFTTTGICKGTQIQFGDTTRSKYGVVNGWSWNFGDPNTLADTSHLQNPKYTYPNPGTYTVTLSVGNSKGCSSNVSRDIVIIDNPTVKTTFKDSSYCGKDTITLHATSSNTGTYTWSPLINIINPNSPDPQVFPTTVTTYRVVIDAGGCTGYDSVIVRPKNDLAATANVSAPNICEEDTLTLTGTSNHTPSQFLWTPSISVANADQAVTKAFPTSTTNYTLTVTWGQHCTSTATKTVNVTKLAVPNAGPDAAICPGVGGTQLNASGGNNYLWRPVKGLSNINISNPVANPDTTTNYIVSVGVTGCSKRREDTVLVSVHSVPPLTITNDTLICSIDTLQLLANGTGSFFWTPNYMISNQNSQNPLVSPDQPTTYTVRLTDNFGCTTTKSVFVNVKQNVTIDAGPDTTICLTDQVTLQPTGDALHFIWSPANLLNDPTAKNPIATPTAPSTTFTVIGNIGKCQGQSSVVVNTVPYPIVTVSDREICFGDTAHLLATGGSIYTWSPAFYLNDPNIPNPIAKPDKTIKYTVSVRDVLGCPKPVTATALVTVDKKIIADAGPRDTSVVINQPLVLHGTGGQFYLWSPPDGLSNPHIATPVATPDSTITYVLTASNAQGCFGTDTITIFVYRVKPGLYVPNAFSPNGDGVNDIFRPIAIGMKQINFFRVFNRWGQLIFETTVPNAGWDGRFKGHPQDAAIYVWMVEGVDYEDNKVAQKGTVMLVR